MPDNQTHDKVDGLRVLSLSPMSYFTTVCCKPHHSNVQVECKMLVGHDEPMAGRAYGRRLIAGAATTTGWEIAPSNHVVFVVSSTAHAS